MCRIPYLGVRMLLVLGEGALGTSCNGHGELNVVRSCISRKAETLLLFGFPCRQHNANQLPGSVLGVSIPPGTLVAMCWDVQATVPLPRVEIKSNL